MTFTVHVHRLTHLLLFGYVFLQREIHTSTEVHSSLRSTRTLVCSIYLLSIYFTPDSVTLLRHYSKVSNTKCLISKFGVLYIYEPTTILASSLDIDISLLLEYYRMMRLSYKHTPTSQDQSNTIESKQCVEVRIYLDVDDSRFTCESERKSLSNTSLHHSSDDFWGKHIRQSLTICEYTKTLFTMSSVNNLVEVSNYKEILVSTTFVTREIHELA